MPDPYPMDSGTWEDLKHRFTYHAPNPEKDQVARYMQIRRMALEFASRICALTPPGRERAVALTNLEQTVMWANAAIARHESVRRETPERITSEKSLDTLSGLRELDAD